MNDLALFDAGTDPDLEDDGEPTIPLTVLVPVELHLSVAHLRRLAELLPDAEAFGEAVTEYVGERALAGDPFAVTMADEWRHMTPYSQADDAALHRTFLDGLRAEFADPAPRSASESEHVG